MNDPFESMRTSAEWPLLAKKSLEEVLGPKRPMATASQGTRGFRCPPTLLADAARLLHAQGARLLTVAATLEPEGEAALTYTFSVTENEMIMLEATSVGRTLDSLFSLFATADFLEREASRVFGIKFVGHPNLAGLAPAASPAREEPSTPQAAGSGRRVREVAP